MTVSNSYIEIRDVNNSKLIFCCDICLTLIHQFKHEHVSSMAATQNSGS